MANPSNLRSRTQQRQPVVEETWDDEQNDDFDVALHLASHAQRLKNVDSSLNNFEKSLKNFQAIYAHERNRQNTLLGIMAGCLVLAVALLIFWPRGGNNSPSAQVAQQRPTPALSQQIAQQQALQQPVQMPQALQTYPQPVITQPPVQNNVGQNNAGQNNLAPTNYAANNYAPQNIQPVRPVVALGARYDQQSGRNTQSYLSAPAAQTIYVAPVQPRLSAFQTLVQNKLASRGEATPSDWQAFFDREARGDKKGKLLIAAKFLKGDGVTRDQAFAVEMIRQAADAGEKEAMMWLAYANQGGSLGKTDVGAAVRWFQAAGKSGVSQAYTELGRIYETGAADGAPDVETAIAWYQRGAQAGDVKAADAINRITTARQPVQQPQYQQPIQPQQIMQPSYAPQTNIQAPAQSPAQQVQQLLQPVTQNNIPDESPQAVAQNQNDIFVPAPIQPPTQSAAQSAAQPASQATAQNDISDIDAVSPAYPAQSYSTSNSTVAATPVVASVPTPAPSTQVGMTKEQASADNKAIQRMLRVLGYKVDRVDGEYGPQTASAIRAYQRDHSVYPDGEPSAELIDALMRDVRGQ